MKAVFVRCAAWTVVTGLVRTIAGCGGDSQPDESSAGSDNAGTDQHVTQSPNTGKRSFKPLKLENGPASSPDATSELTAEQRAQRILDKLQPLQVVLGKWRGTTSKKIGQFNSVEEV